jgi:hypothetical protein
MFPSLTFDCPELEPIVMILEELGKTGSEYRGVHLKGLDRSDSPSNNAQILKWLGESGRKFGELFSGEMDDIASLALLEYMDRIEKALKRAEREAAKIARAKGRAQGIKGKALNALADTAKSKVSNFLRDEQWSKQTASAVLKAAMKGYMKYVVDHIENRKAPGGVKELTENYAIEKKRSVGFEHPIGKRTGQLLENLDDIFAAARIILERK